MQMMVRAIHGDIIPSRWDGDGRIEAEHAKIDAVRYFVYAPNGQRYGPADLATLQQWVAEGRVLPNSLVEDEFGGPQMAASTVPGLIFPTTYAQPQAGPGYSQGPGSPYAENPYNQPQQQSNYYRPPASSYTNAGDVNNAWICAVVGLLCCGPVSIVGIVLANRAKQAGNPNAQAPFILSIIATALWGLGFAFYMIMIAVAMSAG